MKYIFVILLIVCSTVTDCKANGLGDFANTTPGGNQIVDPGGGIILLLKNTNKELKGLQYWYFYKGNIIVKLHDSSFAVCNEKEELIIRFEDQHEFNSFLVNHKLKPKIWTRWYNDNWMVSDILLLWFPFLSLVLIAILILIRIMKGRLEFSSRMKRICGVALVALIILLVLDYNPQSF